MPENPLIANKCRTWLRIFPQYWLQFSWVYFFCLF